MAESNSISLRPANMRLTLLLGCYVVVEPPVCCYWLLLREGLLNTEMSSVRSSGHICLNRLFKLASLRRIMRIRIQKSMRMRSRWLAVSEFLMTSDILLSNSLSLLTYLSLSPMNMIKQTRMKAFMRRLFSVDSLTKNEVVSVTFSRYKRKISLYWS